MKRPINWGKVISLLDAPTYYVGANERFNSSEGAVVVSLPEGSFDSMSSALCHADTEICFNGNVIKGRGEA